jgi:hypothetical protein
LKPRPRTRLARTLPHWTSFPAHVNSGESKKQNPTFLQVYFKKILNEHIKYIKHIKGRLF